MRQPGNLVARKFLKNQALAESFLILLPHFLTIREQTKPKSSCRNQEFSETEIRFWFRSGTILGFLVSVSVPGFKIFELPGYAGSSALNSWFYQELPG